jgi:hypothetical protein
MLHFVSDPLCSGKLLLQRNEGLLCLLLSDVQRYASVHTSVADTL